MQTKTSRQRSKAGRQTDRLTDKLTDRLTETQTDCPTDTQADIQTDEADIQTDRETETHRQTKIKADATRRLIKRVSGKHRQINKPQQQQVMTGADRKHSNRQTDKKPQQIPSDELT